MVSGLHKDSGFSDRLKQLRMQKGWSQVDLAKATGVNSNHISRYERGDSKPTARYLKILADCLGVSTDYLYDGNEEDAATANLKDKELLKMFEEVESFSDNEKKEIKSVIDAFIKRKKLEQLATKAS